MAGCAPHFTSLESPTLLCPKLCPSHSVPEQAQSGTRPDCPELCPEALSIINCVRSGTVRDSPPRVPECRFSPGTVWDTHRVSQTMPKHGLGQGIRVSQTMLSPQARFGTRAECPRPCPGMVWDKAMACPELCST
ncbi:hypothetical protein Bbelb_319810 [Branchiostoma belcheri]|nr:hypothetical protein Bbelb_319810 [Branchiostoma belcheri]